MHKFCYIGIDPAFRNSGFGVCIIDEENTVDFKMFKGFLEFYDWLFEAPANGIYCVENSNLQDVTFNMKGSKGVIASMSRSVGKNQAASQLTFDLCVKLFGKQALEVSPSEKGKKWTHDEMTYIATKEGHKLSNYKGNKNEQDKRDAYKLALIARQKHKI